MEYKLSQTKEMVHLNQRGLPRSDCDLHLKAYATPFLTQTGCEILELNYVVDVVIQEVMMRFDFLSLPSPDTSYFLSSPLPSQGLRFM